MNYLIKILATTAVGATIGVGLYKTFKCKMTTREYTEKCLYLAYLDDGICRYELESRSLDGEEVVFQPKKESLNYRYNLFTEIYVNHTKEEMEKEIKLMETRLQTTVEKLAEKKQEKAVTV